MNGVQDVHPERFLPHAAPLRKFPPDARSVREAREYVRARLVELGGSPDTTERAVVIASELAGNAVLHAATPYSVRITRDGRAVRGEVADGRGHGPWFVDCDSRREPARAEGGRGLVIVQASADRWGVLPDGDGKVVWFEIDDGLGFPGLDDG